MKKKSLVRDAVLQILRRHKAVAAALAFIIAAVVVLSLIPPQLLKIAIDRNFMGATMRGLPRLAACYLLVLLFIGAFDFLKAAVLTVTGQRLVRVLREKMEKKLSRLDSSYFSEHSAGETTSRIMNDVDSVSSLFTDGVISMVIDCAKIVGIVISIWLFSPKLGGIALCLIPIIAVITRAFQKRMRQAQTDNLAELGRVNNHISESIKNIRMIKSFDKEDYMEDIYGTKLAENFRTMSKVNLYDSCYAPVIQVIRAGVIAAVVILSSSQLAWLGISLGMVAASIELISNLFSPIETLGMELQNVQKGLSAIGRIDEFYGLEEEPEKDESLTAERILGNGGAAELVLAHMSFAYGDGGAVLKNIHLTIGAGTSVTLAGRTGVGKSTLMKLLLGILRPTEGAVLLNGIAVGAIPNGEKRKLFGYVQQSFNFVGGTVRRQISLGDSAVTPQAVEKAMRFVGLHDYILSLPRGYDTMVDEKDFSQGQKQLLSIARAVVMEPPILLLDEITANLDAATEARVAAVLQRAAKGRTVISVSHRLTVMQNCDRIVLLENGAVTAEDTPKNMMANNDWFASIVGAQTKHLQA